MAVKRRFIFPDGTVKTEEEMTQQELDAFSEKLNKLLRPLAIEAAIRDLTRERESKAV